MSLFQVLSQQNNNEIGIMHMGPTVRTASLAHTAQIGVYSSHGGRQRGCRHPIWWGVKQARRGYVAQPRSHGK